MKFFGTLMLFGGYVLVYSAVANSGKFASEPWLGLFTDAYSVPSTSSTSTNGGGGTTSTASTTTTASNGIRTRSFTTNPIQTTA
jgi:hypothetical protein